MGCPTGPENQPHRKVDRSSRLPSAKLPKIGDAAGAELTPAKSAW